MGAGGCLYKVINRGIATLGGGSLGLAAHWMADKAGPKAEPVILSASVFLLGRKLMNMQAWLVWTDVYLLIRPHF